jgi:hypothetical protein
VAGLDHPGLRSRSPQLPVDRATRAGGRHRALDIYANKPDAFDEDADEAFTILTKLSQDTNRKLRDVAVLLVERSTTPKC